MIGDGCCAFVSISLGQNEVPKAKRSVGNAVVMCLVSSIVLAALYLTPSPLGCTLAQATSSALSPLPC